MHRSPLHRRRRGPAPGGTGGAARPGPSHSRPPSTASSSRATRGSRASQIVGTSGLIVQPARQLPRHPARHHRPLPHRAVRRRAWSSSAPSARRLILMIRVKERPVLREVGGARASTKVSEGEVKGRVKLQRGPAARPQRGGAVPRRHRFAVQARRATTPRRSRSSSWPRPTGKLRIVFDVNEGERVAISQVIVDGNERFSDKQVVKHMATPPRGLLVVPEGRVRRAAGGPGRARAAAALVRRPRARSTSR